MQCVLFEFRLRFVSICRAFIKKKGRNNVTVDDLVHLITPKGRGTACYHSHKSRFTFASRSLFVVFCQNALLKLK